MTEPDEQEDPKREERIRKIQALLSKTVANGCTEEEMNSAQDAAQRLMEKWAIEDGDLGIGDKFRLYEQSLKISHPDSDWRRRLCQSVAMNTGVFYVTLGKWKGGKKGAAGTGMGDAVYAGQEHAVKGAALVAEYLVKVVEDLGTQYARSIGGNQTARRQFQKACGLRTATRVRQSFNLSGDPALPLVISNNRELARSGMEEKHGNFTSRKGGPKMSGSEHEFAGMMAADGIDLRGHNRKKQIA